MADYRICVCDQRPVHRPTEHAHIVAVGLGNNASYPDQILTLHEVLVAMRNGHRFFTFGERSGAWAEVRQVGCPECGERAYIRSAPDATYDNNLDKLPRRYLI